MVWLDSDPNDHVSYVSEYDVFSRSWAA